MTDPIQSARERFERDTAEHQMTVLHDDGLYRHLRFQRPGSWIYGYDLVTWPGYLTICGDVGDYTFARLRDMFEFFKSPSGINPGYWGEKLQTPRGAGSDLARVFSPERYVERVNGWLEDAVDDLTADQAERVRAAVREDLLEPYVPATDAEAYQRLSDFSVGGVHIYDPTDWELRDFHGTFLWCCWAIARGVANYHAAQAVPA